MTIDRSLFIVFPTRAIFISTKRKTLIYIFFSYFINLLGNSYLGFMYDKLLLIKNPYDKWSSSVYCLSTRKSWQFFEKHARPIFEILTIIVLPGFVLIITNICMLRAIILAKMKRKVLTKDNTSKNSTKAITSSIILLMISTYFIISAIPTIYIYVFAYYYMDKRDTKDIQFTKKAAIVSDFFLTSNSSFNFVFYCLSGRKFRQNFFELFQKPKKSNKTIISLIDVTKKSIIS